METKELMIGNWVCYSERPNEPIQVVNVGSYSVALTYYGHEGYVFEPELDDIQPIEMTEEILLKNGFEKEGVHISSGIDEILYTLNTKYGYIIIGHSSNSSGKDWYCHIDNSRLESIGGFDFQYVHQLQNGIRLITGKDMEVKL